MSSQTQQSESCYVIHFTKSHQILNSYFSTPMVVVIVFGIPGSGKTTFARNLKAFCIASGITSSLISFDDVSVNKALTWNDQSFQALRREALGMIGDLVPNLLQGDSTELPTNLHVTIVDDIMHLRSMRREVYVLARDRGVPIISVWISADIETAFARNHLRTGAERIPEDTIMKIHSALQPPDPVHIFDRNSITVDGNAATIDSSIMDTVLELASSLWERTIVTAAAARENAAAVQAPSCASQGSASFIKAVDAALRAVVAEGMSVRKQFTSLDSKTLGKAFASAKADILTAARNRDVQDAQGAGVVEGYCLDLISLVQQNYMSSETEHSDSAVDLCGHLIGFVEHMNTIKS